MFGGASWIASCVVCEKRWRSLVSEKNSGYEKYPFLAGGLSKTVTGSLVGQACSCTSMRSVEWALTHRNKPILLTGLTSKVTL
jgi:hypothetical protein